MKRMNMCVFAVIIGLAGCQGDLVEPYYAPDGANSAHGQDDLPLARGDVSLGASPDAGVEEDSKTGAKLDSGSTSNKQDSKTGAKLDSGSTSNKQDSKTGAKLDSGSSAKRDSRHHKDSGKNKSDCGKPRRKKTNCGKKKCKCPDSNKNCTKPYYI